MTAEEFKKYSGKKTTGEKCGNILSGGKIIGYDPKDSHHLQLLAIDDNYGDSGRMFEVVIPDKDDLKGYLCGKHKYLWVTIENAIMDEPKELDLAKVLKGCEGVTLWSDIAGEVELYKIIENSDFPIKVKNFFGCESFSSKGAYLDIYPNAKCLLWPSETNHDWSTFKKPITVNDDDWVVACDSNETGVVIQYGRIYMCWKYAIPFDKFRPNMTDEELKKLSVI